MATTLFSGNEAIARGAFEAGATVGVGYPGTPSTEILENLAKYEGVYTEWSVNEKVALEVGLGASLAGARTLVTMKHVGVNVAADPLFTAVYTGVSGGLVLAAADDPDMHSSQNEQDSRHYGRAAKLPVLEPADSEEARAMVINAFALSEAFDTPVMVRSTTRLSHGRSVVRTLGERLAPTGKGFVPNKQKYVMIPAWARLAHRRVEERIARLAEHAETLIRREPGTTDGIGFITSGIAYTYVKEAFPDAPVLKLGMVWPLPLRAISEFVASVKRAVVVEELDPFLETEIRARGIAVEGKNLFSVIGEFDPRTLAEAIVPGSRLLEALPPPPFTLPPRPPALCPGCPHQQVFRTLNRLGITVTGDIGCYTLGTLPPYSAMDTCVDMGASVTMAQGIEIAETALGLPKRKLAAVIGDSTFAHSGITGLINAAYNRRHSLVVVLDNGTTAMTGMQPNPFSGETLMGEASPPLEYEALAAAVGIEAENVRIVNAWKAEEIDAAIIELSGREVLTLLVVKGTCVILKRRQAKKAGLGEGKQDV